MTKKSSREISKPYINKEVKNQINSSENNINKYCAELLGSFSKETETIINKIKGKKYKAIVYYPATFKTVDQHSYSVLKKFAEKGYLCFFTNTVSNNNLIEEVEENLFVLSNDSFLLPILRCEYVLIYCTYILQTKIAEFLPYKYLWFNVLNNDPQKIKRITQIVNNADLLTYSNKPANELLEYFEQNALKDLKAWKVYGNLDVNNKISVMTPAFFNRNGENYYSGGGERYLVDLYDLFKQYNYTMTIYQKGNFPWVRRYGEIDVISLYRGDPKQYTFDRVFHDLIEKRSILNIYSAFFEAWPMVSKPSIGISHGVAWDKVTNKFNTGDRYWQSNERFIESAKLCNEIISVDTNTVNWFQTIDYETSKKMRVIPNYVDLNVFKPVEGNKKNKNKIVILYPRRLYKPRGYYLVLEILDEILTKYRNVEFHFVGHGIYKDTKYVLEKQKIWGERVKWKKLSPNEMDEAYNKADITLIPTVNSEGTSLSCLEAMASRNAIIATRVGGLTDLIIDGFNGLLIEPNSEALKSAIIDLIENKEKLKRLKKHAIEVASSFSKEVWLERWKKTVQKYIPKNNEKLSKNRLIEIYINDLTEYKELLGKLIISLLLNGDLIYIYVKDKGVNNKLSFGRVQWVGWDEYSYAKADFVIVDKKLDKKEDVKADLIISKIWLEEFHKNSQKHYSELGITK